MSGAAVNACTRVANVLIDAEVHADVSRGLSRNYRMRNETATEYAQWIEREMRGLVREFEEFVRDHRSMDWVQLSVERVVQDQCSACGNEWEPDNDGRGGFVCASCGAEVTS